MNVALDQLSNGLVTAYAIPPPRDGKISSQSQVYTISSHKQIEVSSAWTVIIEYSYGGQKGGFRVISWIEEGESTDNAQPSLVPTPEVEVTQEEYDQEIYDMLDAKIEEMQKNLTEAIERRDVEIDRAEELQDKYDQVSTEYNE